MMNDQRLRTASKEAARREMRFLRGAIIGLAGWILLAWVWALGAEWIFNR